MQIKGEEFLKKVQLQQEREELERKLSEIEEVRSSIGNNNQSYSNTIKEENEHELDNIMIDTSFGRTEDNKKKYLILAIVLVILFLLTIIIIRLLSNNPNKDDQFTAGANPTDMKKLPENGSNIEENYQKIMNDRLKKDSSDSSSQNSGDDRLKALQQQVNDNQLKDIKEENSGGVSNEALEETMKKIEEKRNSVKDKTVTTEPTKKTPVTKEVVSEPVKKVKEVEEKKIDSTKSVKELMNSHTPPATTTNVSSKIAAEKTSTYTSGNYFIQIGAFSKKPTDSYLNSIKSANLKYKIQEDTRNGTTFSKVLIGPYSSKETAADAVSSVKQKLNVSSAFVVKF